MRSQTRYHRDSVYLLDDGSDVWKALLVICTWPTVSANHAVKFSMGPRLNLWVRRDERQEPRDYARSLSKTIPRLFQSGFVGGNYIRIYHTEWTPPRVNTADSMHKSSQSSFSRSCVSRSVLTRQSGTSSPASMRAFTRMIMAP